MASLSWYWHRLGAMTTLEMALHARNKVREFTDSRRTWNGTSLNLKCSSTFPRLPSQQEAPEVVRKTLRRDVEDILAGRWKAFGHLDLQVDDPPRWQCDYLSGRDLATTEWGFRLDHRELPGGTDVKLIWELSRWHQLVRLAMAAYVLGDQPVRGKCVDWLDDWVMHNPPYRGWNWTSALEVGMRLVQFTWIDALLSQRSAAPAAGGDPHQTPDPVLERRLESLRHAILPAHVRYTWRHQSFGSSANNHLLGELAGCVLATVRWPDLAQLAAPLTDLQAHWEREVLAQFAPDGGNREQALNYHLFAFELCWQTLKGLQAAGRTVSVAVQQRLARAAEFYVNIQAGEPWDYGDSDGAFVTPFFGSDAVQEWHKWLKAPSTSAAIVYWLGESPSSTSLRERRQPLNTARKCEWRFYSETGIAICEADPWWMRWDVSSLGHLRTAPHGHLDALHLSIWVGGVALVIDPGTGAYYSDEGLRTWLASRAAHNGPCPKGTEKPRRLGPFLWAAHHPVPAFQAAGAAGVACLDLWGTRVRRRIAATKVGGGYQVEDECFGKNGRAAPFRVRWQFAPDTTVRALAERSFSVERAGAGITLEAGAGWAAVELGEGIVSPAFRKTCRAPFLELTARPSGEKPSLFRTTFLTSAHR
jgi:hypothetical protein